MSESQSIDDREVIRTKLVGYIIRFTSNTELQNITEETNLESFGLDSLAIFEFVLGLEEEFDLVFDDHHFNIANFQTIKDTIDLICAMNGRSQTSHSAP